MTAPGPGLEPAAVARVLDDAGDPVGAGFLVGPDLVATCAHVVATATGDDPRSQRPPELAVAVELPLRRAGAVAARVLRWSPITPDGRGDVALLRLDRAAAGVPIPPVRRADDRWGSPYRVLGFPVRAPDGVWATGVLRAGQGTRWHQLQGAPGDTALEEGFSGAPVWDDETGAVIGMTVAADRDPGATTAFMIPVAEVLGLDPELLPCPYRGLEPFGEEHAAFFFGREAEVAAVLDRLAAAGPGDIVVVAGASGSGKSSLVAAGVVPRLRAAGTGVSVVEVRPGTSPDAVAATLDAPRGGDTAAHPPHVVVLDQLEELAGSDGAAARDVVDRSRRGARVLLTVRPDVLEVLLSGALAPALDRGLVLLPALDRPALRAAVVGPAERAPGLRFEDGLVETLLDDAGSEPGRMPLVSSLLAQLWERRSGGALLLSDYRDLGGVAGALRRRAEEAVAGLGAEDEDVLRRVLTALARPDERGRFERRPVPTASLGAPERLLVDRLAAARLVVVGPAVDGAPTVELAHQALVEHWPRLRALLTDDRDLLRWRVEVEGARRRWESAGRDTGSLLRGAGLATAAEWVERRGDDVEPPVRAYVAAGAAHRRGELRRWQLVTALLAVLALGSGVLAVTAQRRGDRLDRQLTTAGAATLGAEASARFGANPVAGTQFALAAWRADPGVPAARDALARAALATRHVDAVLPGLLTPGQPRLAMSRDGARTVVFGGGERVDVVDGVGSDAPRSTSLEDGPAAVTALTPDGGAVVGVDAVTGTVTRHEFGVGTVVLRGPVRSDGRGRSQSPVAFSPDGRRMAVVDPGPDGRGTVTLLDAAGGPSRTLGPLAEPTAAWPTADPDRVLVRQGGGGERSSSRLTAYSLAAASPPLPLPARSVVAGHGEWLISCVESGGGTGELAGVEVRPADTAAAGAPGRRIALDAAPCASPGALRLTGDREHVLAVAASSQGKDYRRADVASLRDGRVETFMLPGEDLVAAPEGPVSAAPDTGVFRDGADRTTLVIATAGSGDLLRLRGGAPRARAGSRELPTQLAADPRYGLVGGDRLVDASSGAPLAPLPAGPAPLATTVHDEVWRLRGGPSRYTVERFALPDARPLPAITLPDPGDPEALGVSVTIRDGRIAALHGGVLSMWSTSDGRSLAAPLPLVRGPADRVAARRFASVLIRPGRPDEVVVGAPSGSVERWDVVAGRRLAELGEGSSVALSGDGARYALLSSGFIEVRDLDSGELLRPPMPLGGVESLVGFTPDGYLVVLTSDLQQRVRFVDIDRGGFSAGLRLAHGLPAAPALTDGSLDLTEPGSLPVRFGLTAPTWFARLCGLLDREFSPGQLERLPPGIDPERPCSR